MLEDIKAVLFDLDGTLVDSMWVWKEIDIEYFARFHLAIPEGYQSEIEGMSFSETAEYTKNKYQIPDPVEKIKADWNEMAWEKYTNKVPLKEGAKEFLDYCLRNHIKLGIATSNSRELVSNIIKVHGLDDYFTGIVTGCEVEKGKPAPDVYLEAAKRCDVSPEHCLVFEDIIPGILAAKAAGMKVCAVEDSYSVSQKEDKQKIADYYIENYFDITT